MLTTRRSFIGGATASAVGLCSPAFATSNSPRWFRGSVHCHTYWSDGRGFPEDCASSYKRLGYDFLVFTDHNRIGSNPDCWRNVEPADLRWPPEVSQAVFDHYVATYSHAKTRKDANGKTQVRLQPIDETIKMFGEYGKPIRHRTYPIYSDEIGQTVKLVEGKPGEAVSAAYTLRPDDLYVRARVESDEPSFVTPVPTFHPTNAAAWTQPYSRPANT